MTPTTLSSSYSGPSQPIHSEDKNKQPCPELYPHILLHIFDKIPFKQYRNLALVSKQWHEVTYDPRLGYHWYRQLVKEVIPTTYLLKPIDLFKLYSADIKMNIYAVKFPKNPSGPLQILQKQESKMVPADFLERMNPKELFNPQQVSFVSKRIQDPDLRGYHFYIQDYYIITGHEADTIHKAIGEYQQFYFTQRTGVIYRVKSHLKGKYLKIAREIQEDSPTLMKEKIEESLANKKRKAEDQKVKTEQPKLRRHNSA